MPLRDGFPTFMVTLAPACIGLFRVPVAHSATARRPYMELVCGFNMHQHRCQHGLLPGQERRLFV